LLGGAASVWTTALVFFQAVLLAGYLYADGIGRLASVRSQALIHIILMASVLAFLPFRFEAAAGADEYRNPVAWELWRLVRSAGVPLFAIFAPAPLLQA